MNREKYGDFCEKYEKVNVKEMWKVCQQHYHSLHWKKLSQKLLQFIMQLENPKKGDHCNRERMDDT